MSSVKILLAPILCAFMMQATVVAQADRVALVIGNDAYKHASRLDNAARDATAVAKMLREELGFDVIADSNVTTATFDTHLDAFQTKARRAKLVIVYYAGHGMEHDGQNYIIPVDTKLERSSQLKRQTVAVQSILAGLKDSGVAAKLVILDCCRDLPLGRVVDT